MRTTPLRFLRKCVRDGSASDRDLFYIVIMGDVEKATQRQAHFDKRKSGSARRWRVVLDPRKLLCGAPDSVLAFVSAIYAFLLFTTSFSVP